MKSYKSQLDALNDKANEMFDHMKEINKIVNQKILEIETVVTKSESNFVEEIHKLIRAKDELQKLQNKRGVRKTEWMKYLFHFFTLFTKDSQKLTNK